MKNMLTPVTNCHNNDKFTEISNVQIVTRAFWSFCYLCLFFDSVRLQDEGLILRSE